MTWSTPIDLNPDELCYQQFMDSLDRCDEWALDNPSAIILDLSDRICIPNKTEDANLKAFNTLTGINESKH